MKITSRISISFIAFFVLTMNVYAISPLKVEKNKKYKQWIIGANKTGYLYTMKSRKASRKYFYNIKGLVLRKFLHYEKQGIAGGINLGWTSNASAKTAGKRSRWYFTRKGGSKRPVAYGETIAIAWGKAGYIKYGKRTRGINLKWSKKPIFQWRILGGKRGTPVRLRKDRVILYNTRNKQPLIYFKRRHAGNIGWANSTTLGRKIKRAGKKVVKGAKNAGKKVGKGIKKAGSTVKSIAKGSKGILRRLNARRKKCKKRKDRCTNCHPPKSKADRDKDGVPDLLEYKLAHKFFPRVIAYGKIFDLHQYYHYRGYSTPFTVRPYSKGPCRGKIKCLEIRMSITFLMDAGGPRGLFGHIGDGEMYMAIVRRTRSWSQARNNVNKWVLISDFATAHWGHSGSDASKSRAYKPGRRSRVTIHAAKKKHALYHSRRACEKAVFRLEKCPGKGHDLLKYKNRKLQNIGSRRYHSGMDVTMAHPECGSYYVWGNRKFAEDIKIREYFEKTRIPYKFR